MMIFNDPFCPKAAKIIYMGGCLVGFETLIVKNIVAVGGVGVGIALMQVETDLFFFS